MPLVRHPANPILTRRDIPAIRPHLVDVSSVFNPGAVRFGDRDILLLRVQNRGRETFLLVAESRDGARFVVRERLVKFRGLERLPGPIFHVYDPRLTLLDGACYIVFAMDTPGGCKLGLARTVDFEAFDFLGLVAEDDSRNGVLFPERVGGRYLLLERPNRTRLAGGPVSGDTIVLSASDDLVTWRRLGPAFQGRPHYWDELVGSGPPPVKTAAGWLHIYHGVATHFAAANIYQAGVVLLDLHDPSRVVARSRYNILEPREAWELAGQVPNVVFPSGMIVEDVDERGFARPESPVRIYYGAADTCVGLATTTVQELIDACWEGNELQA